MLIKLKQLIKHYNLTINGILHIGSNNCYDLKEYEENNIFRENIFWVESLPNNIHICKKTYNDINIYNGVIDSEDNKEVRFNIANNYKYSSILPFGKIQKQYFQKITIIKSLPMKTTRLDTLIQEKHIPIEYVNFININTQGTSLRTLKSMEKYLYDVKYIYTTVSTKEFYMNNDLLNDIDIYLFQFGFRRVAQYINTQGPQNTQDGLGEVFYIKKSNKKNIYIDENNNFGNKILGLILGVYLYNIYKGHCIINYVLGKSTEEKKTDPNIDKIFSKSLNKINYISQLDYDNINLKHKVKTIRIPDTLLESAYKDLYTHTKIENNLSLVYKMYDTFTQLDKNIFEHIDQDILTNKKRVYDKYISVVNANLELDKNRWYFKSHRDYTEILENLGRYYGNLYMAEIKNTFNELFTTYKQFFIKLCAENDRYGKTYKKEFEGFANCSPSNLRYILHSLLILTFIKNNNLNQLDIIEIGGGYGGLALFMIRISKLFNVSINSYTIFDIPEVMALQKKYLDTLNVRNVYFCNLSSNNFKILKKNSFLISNYAFSEISMDLQKEYTEKVLNPYVSYGYVIWNYIPIYNFIEDKIISKVLEVPDTSDSNTNYYLTFVPK